MTAGPERRETGQAEGAVPDLAVVILAWNERENLELLLPALKATLDDLGIRWEIVVVDGGSQDGTGEAALRRGACVVRQRERGFGAALVEGIRATTARWIATMDADLSHRPAFLADLWRHRDSAELLIASRYVPGGRSDTSRFRRLLSRILNTVYTRALSLPLKDISGNFRLYRRDVLDGITLVARDFDVLEEVLIKVVAQGFRVRELPFHYRSRGSGSSHARLLKFAWAYARTLARMWRLRNSVASADYDHRAFDSPIWLQRYWQRTRQRIILEFLRASGLPPGAAVLDIGCGSSRIIQGLPAAVGLDILLPKLRFLRGRGHRRLVQGSGFALPFPDAAFDVVINSEVIEHVPDEPPLWAEMRRVLRPGGTLLLGTPDYGRRLWWILEWCYGKILPGAYAEEHVTHYTRADLEARLAQGGYRIRGCAYVGFCEMIFCATAPPDRTPTDASRV
jgi:dolichol-phosphate mannosyltransferase